MTKIFGRMGRNRLLLVLLVAAIVSPLFSCGHTDATTADIFSISGQVTSGGSGLAGVTITLSGSNQGTVNSDAKVTVPESVKVGRLLGVAMKLTPVRLTPSIVCTRLAALHPAMSGSVLVP
jgi:hypothetical protein